MIDFSISEIPSYGYKFCGLLFFIIICLFWRQCITYTPSIRRSRASIVFLCLFFLLFAITWWVDDDFFGYMENVRLFGSNAYTFHLEKVYEYIILFTRKNYLLFRVVVWGGALLLYIYTSHIYGVDVLLALFLLFLLFASTFSYARASLAMSVYFLGVSFFARFREKGVFSLIVGVLLMVSSYFFHKSMVVMILLAPLYFINISRKNILFFIIPTVVLLGYALDYLINSFMISLMDLGDAQLAEKLEFNLENNTIRSGHNATIFGWISYVWYYAVFYLSFIIVSSVFLGKKQVSISKPFRGLFNLTFSVILLSTSLLLFSARSMVYFYRYLFMSIIPLSVLIAYLRTNNLLSKRAFNIIVFVCGGYNIWTFFTYLFR